MSLFFAISGAQGTGKSTILKDLDNSEIAKSIYFDDFKVSRSVQKTFGYEKLADAYATPSKMMDFQQAILKAKIYRDETLANTIFLPYILTERSFLDIAVYTNIWISKLVDDNVAIDELTDWQKEYFVQCFEYQKKLYDGIFYIHRHHVVKFEEDKNRADEKDSDAFDEIANTISILWSAMGAPTIFSVDTGDRQERVNNITRILIAEKENYVYATR